MRSLAVRTLGLDEPVAFEALERRVDLPDVERPYVPGTLLELLPKLQPVLRTFTEQGEQCMTDAHGRARRSRGHTPWLRGPSLARHTRYDTRYILVQEPIETLGVFLRGPVDLPGFAGPLAVAPQYCSMSASGSHLLAHAGHDNMSLPWEGAYATGDRISEIERGLRGLSGFRRRPS